LKVQTTTGFGSRLYFFISREYAFEARATVDLVVLQQTNAARSREPEADYPIEREAPHRVDRGGAQPFASVTARQLGAAHAVTLTYRRQQMRIISNSIGLILILALLTALIPASVRAAENGAEETRALRLYASAHLGPIGAVKLNSLTAGAVAIDGRIGQAEIPIWGGELIRVLSDRKVQVALDSIGQVTLGRGASVRFATARAALNDISHEVLVASLVEGSIDVKLNSDAAAYVEAAGSTFTASVGSSFSVGVQEGHALLSTVAGVVRTQDQPTPQDVNIRIVDELGRPVSSGSQLSVRARSTRQIQVQVTDKNDKPLPDLPVLFSLGDPCLGSLGLGVAAGGTFRQKTDKRGIAAVPLVAGAARCAASIVAKVEGTNASVTIHATVKPNARFLNTQNTLIIVAALVAAGVVIGLVVSNSGSEPIRAVPPPTINPGR
jgi:uncharacterized protein YaiE (UPF0345 family)